MIIYARGRSSRPAKKKKGQVLSGSRQFFDSSILPASSAFVATYAPGKQCTWLSTSMLPRLLGSIPNPLIAFAAAASGLSLPGAACPDPPPPPSWLPPGLRGSGGGLLLLPSCLMVNFCQHSSGFARGSPLFLAVSPIREKLRFFQVFPCFPRASSVDPGCYFAVISGKNPAYVRKCTHFDLFRVQIPRILPVLHLLAGDFCGFLFVPSLFIGCAARGHGDPPSGVLWTQKHRLHIGAFPRGFLAAPELFRR